MTLRQQKTMYPEDHLPVIVLPSKHIIKVAKLYQSICLLDMGHSCLEDLGISVEKKKNSKRMLTWLSD